MRVCMLSQRVLFKGGGGGHTTVEKGETAATSSAGANFFLPTPHMAQAGGKETERPGAQARPQAPHHKGAGGWDTMGSWGGGGGGAQARHHVYHEEVKSVMRAVIKSSSSSTVPSDVVRLL